jgi:hypothetical protein
MVTLRLAMRTSSALPETAGQPKAGLVRVNVAFVGEPGVTFR